MHRSFPHPTPPHPTPHPTLPPATLLLLHLLHLPAGRVFWFAFMPHVFFPQRGANFAYPLALLALLLVWKGTDTTPVAAAAGVTAGDRRRMLMHAAAFAALTPLVQAHSFIGLAIIIGTVFVLDAHKWLADLRVLGAWIAAGAIAALVGVPQMALFRKHVASGHGGSFIKQGWIHKNNPFGTAEGLFAAIPMAGGFFRFWWMSLGPAVPLFLVALAIYGYDALQGARLGAAPVVPVPGAPAAAAVAGKAASVAASDSTAAGRASGVAGGADAGIRRRVGGGSDSDEGEGSPAGAAAAPKARDFRAGGGAGSSSASAAHHMSVFGPADGTSSADASLAEHLIAVTLAQLPAPIAGRLTGAIPVRYTALDSIAAGGNANSITGRSLDALKFGIGALAIFLFGNYVNLQPWDRDNCKLFYVWLFVARCVATAVVAGVVGSCCICLSLLPSRPCARMPSYRPLSLPSLTCLPLHLPIYPSPSHSHSSAYPASSTRRTACPHSHSHSHSCPHCPRPPSLTLLQPADGLAAGLPHRVRRRRHPPRRVRLHGRPAHPAGRLRAAAAHPAGGRRRRARVRQVGQGEGRGRGCRCCGQPRRRRRCRGHWRRADGPGPHSLLGGSPRRACAAVPGHVQRLPAAGPREDAVPPAAGRGADSGAPDAAAQTAFQNFRFSPLHRLPPSSSPTVPAVFPSARCALPRVPLPVPPPPPSPPSFPPPLQMGMYIKEHLAPKSVIAHRDIHIMPSGCIAGRPSLVAYTGASPNRQTQPALRLCSAVFL